jgi:hypothetical protein
VLEGRSKNGTETCISEHKQGMHDLNALLTIVCKRVKRTSLLRSPKTRNSPVEKGQSEPDPASPVSQVEPNKGAACMQEISKGTS